MRIKLVGGPRDGTELDIHKNLAFRPINVSFVDGQAFKQLRYEPAERTETEPVPYEYKGEV
jgi:hypothetical protein